MRNNGKRETLSLAQMFFFFVKKQININNYSIISICYDRVSNIAEAANSTFQFERCKADSQSLRPAKPNLKQKSSKIHHYYEKQKLLT